MTQKNKTHTFHIPVMGLAFTIDSPIRIAQYGIDSVVSIMDDNLTEQMRAFYSNKFQLPYSEIRIKSEDSRAKRITAYLNLMGEIVSKKFESFKSELVKSRESLNDFISILPKETILREKLEEFLNTNKGKLTEKLTELSRIFDNYLKSGSIDVNIMTKLDRENWVGKEKLAPYYNDGHAALRGFANSSLNSSIIFSAGMNPRLFSYMENFDDFYPNENGEIKKKITLKVSDYRSAQIQGSFLAKKGLWVSEYRIESGLNCGGHAFATNGHLMGPILEEFKSKKQELYETTFSLLTKALTQKEKPVPGELPKLKISAQGGVGTAEEHSFFLDHYQVDSVGWGSPFLLVPEATSLDNDSRRLLADAKEEDLYLSDISPLGVPFHTVKGTTNEFYKNKRIEENKAGSSCPKKFLALSKEYGDEGICPASKKYQDKKIAELKEMYAPESYEYKKQFDKITEKACLCVSLANSSLVEKDITIKGQKQGVVICPGPNMAYFSKEISLKEMVQHIYGVKETEAHENRPNVFIKELGLYFEYLTKQINEAFEAIEINDRQIKKLEEFRDNLIDGINYYKDLFRTSNYFKQKTEEIQNQLNGFEKKLIALGIRKEVAIA